MTTFKTLIIRTALLSALAISAGFGSSALANDALSADLKVDGHNRSATVAEWNHSAEDACQSEADRRGVRLVTVHYEIVAAVSKVHCGFDAKLQMASMSIENTQDENFGSL